MANKVERVALSGGLIGMLTTNPKAAIDKVLVRENAEGWKAVHVEPHSTSNLFVNFLQLLILVCTIGLWTFGAGYMILFEKG